MKRTRNTKQNYRRWLAQANHAKGHRNQQSKMYIYPNWR